MSTPQTTEEKGIAALDKIQAHIDREAKLEARLRKTLVRGVDTDLWRCAECGARWHNDTDDTANDRHHEGCVLRRPDQPEG